MNTIELPTLNDAVKRLKAAARRDIRKHNGGLIDIPDRAVYAKMVSAIVEDGGNAAQYMAFIDAFLVVYVQNQKRGGVTIPDMLDIIAERFRQVLEGAEEMERIAIIQARPLS